MSVLLPRNSLPARVCEWDAMIICKTYHLLADGSVVYRNKGCGFHETSLGDCIVVSSLFRKVLLLTREDVRKSGERN